LKEVEAKMEEQLTTVRSSYEKKIADLKTINEVSFASLNAYAEANPQLFEESKTVEFIHGSISLRKGTFAFATLKGFTSALVIANLKLAKLQRFISTKVTESIDKNALIASRDDAKIVKKFKELGFEIKQEEYFHFDTKLENLN
jgi:phage host-nuclease inhibitor protein Gam